MALRRASCAGSLVTTHSLDRCAGPWGPSSPLGTAPPSQKAPSTGLPGPREPLPAPALTSILIAPGAMGHVPTRQVALLNERARWGGKEAARAQVLPLGRAERASPPRTCRPLASHFGSRRLAHGLLSGSRGPWRERRRFSQSWSLQGQGAGRGPLGPTGPATPERLPEDQVTAPPKRHSEQEPKDLGVRTPPG